MWIKIILVAEIFFTVGQVRSDMELMSSRACFGSPGVACTDHKINCEESEKIAIHDAYFTSNDECPLQGVLGCPNDFEKIQEKEPSYQFRKKNFTSLYTDCSSKDKCNFYGGRNYLDKTFSVIKYDCIADTNLISKCNGTTITGSDVSLLFMNLESDCTCFVCKEAHTTTFIHLLDIHLPSDPCTILGVYDNGITHTYNYTTPPEPYRLLNNGTKPDNDGHTRVFIQNPDSTAKIWIQIKGSEKITINCQSSQNTEPCPPSGSGHGESSTNDSGANSGAVAAGVTVAVLVIVAVVLVLLWFRYKRNQNSKPKHSIEKTSDEKYSVATRMPDHNYHEIGAMRPKQPTSNYDYATVTQEVKHARREGQSSVEEDYAQIGDKRPNETGHNNTTLFKAKSYNNKSFTENEDDYNHLGSNEKTQPIENGAHSGGYDTAVSASKYVQHIRNKGIPKVDSECDYNHIDNNPKHKPLQGDYDTTASASKAVTKMIETNEQTEDDYDHFRQTKARSQAADSPYDTAEHHAEHHAEHSGDYSIAGVIQKNGPYE